MTGKKQKALAALARSPTKREAARQAGISESSLRRWLATDREFQAEYRQMMDTILEDAATQAKQSLCCALIALREITENTNEQAPARVSAARTLIESCLKLNEAANIERRLSELETALVNLGGENV